MKTLIKLYLLIVILLVFFAGCSDTSESDASEDELETAIVTADNTATTAPVIAEVTAVTTPTNDTTPDYTFSSDEAGTITYGGSCSSSTTSATTGNNTITLVSLSDGTYSNCTIIVTDSTPNYTFSSNIAGNITYGGSCSSSTTTVIQGNNTITLDSLSDGTYSDCTITVDTANRWLSLIHI